MPVTDFVKGLPGGPGDLGQKRDKDEEERIRSGVKDAEAKGEAGGSLKEALDRKTAFDDARQK